MKAASYALLALVLALTGCASPRVAFSDAQYAYARADFQEAWIKIQQARREFPESTDIEEAYEQIRIAYLLDLGRVAVFQNRDLAGIEVFERVLVLSPDNDIALRWIEKARSKLAMREARKGDRQAAGGDLEAALRSYRGSLDYVEDNALAVAGLKRLGDLMEVRRGEARDHYLDGVRALADQLFQQTRYHMLIALDKDPSLEEARGPARRARRRLVEDRYDAARAMEAEGFYDAALSEYKVLARLEVEAGESLPGLVERTEIAQREVRAGQLLAKGEMAALRDDFDGAREALEEAQSLTSARALEVANALLQVEERELMNLYLSARDKEFQGKLREAQAELEAIDKRMRGFRDVRARISELVIRIQEADKAWTTAQEADAAGDQEAALTAYRDVLLYWPEYEGVQDKVDALEAAGVGKQEAEPDGSR